MASSFSWTPTQNKLFEDDLAIYELLVEDVRQIDAGHVPLPNYIKSSKGYNSERKPYFY